MKPKDFAQLITNMYASLPRKDKQNFRHWVSMAVAQLERAGAQHDTVENVQRKMIRFWHEHSETGSLVCTLNQFTSYVAYHSNGKMVINMEVVVDEDSDEPLVRRRYFLDPRFDVTDELIAEVVEQYAKDASDHLTIYLTTP